MVEEQRLALLLWGTKSDGSDEVVLRSGVLRREADAAVFWHRGKPALEMREEWLARIQETKPEFADIVGDAPYVLSLSVGDVTDDEAKSMDRIGLKWAT